ncbi:MAG TPA: response regulator transcription factor [Terriglobia bacterium]|nr:response regulator transcription factor [Terriglobia bacterium]
MSTASILVVDDDPQIRRVMRVALVANGYIVNDARSGEGALEALRKSKYDLVLLDINMPGMGGLETCRLIRTTSEIPIIMLTVRSSESDKVEALDAGADDYVTKPFGTPELLARIRAALRRSTLAEDGLPESLALGEIEVCFNIRRLRKGALELPLTPKETDLLRYLAANSNAPVPHARLLQTIWGPDYGNEVEYLRVFINHLRKKIEPDPSNPQFLLTVPRVGYQLQVPPQR